MPASPPATAEHQDLAGDRAAPAPGPSAGPVPLPSAGREPTTTDLRQLAAAAIHEIRNPLNTMAIHCELLESRLHKDRDRAGLADKEREAMLRSVAVLSGEVQRIDRVLDQFLVHAGPPEAAREPVDADQWLAEVVQQAEQHAAGRGVAVRLRHPPLGRWNVDPQSLARAVQAVLDNAVLATPPGGQVEIEAEGDGEQAVIRVIDHGEGIPPEREKNVCLMGYTTRQGHAGLGLTIAKQVVKAQHGGNLQIDSVLGQGTKVTLTVPLDDEI